MIAGGSVFGAKYEGSTKKGVGCRERRRSISHESPCNLESAIV